MKNFSFYVYIGLFSVYLVVMFRTPDRSPDPEDQQPAGEERFLRIATVLFLLWWVSFLIPFVSFLFPSFMAPFSMGPAIPMAIIGTVIFALGTAVRTIAVRTLDHYFTYQLCIREEHRLIQHGIYRYLRHPSYTGTLLEAIGMLVAARSAYGLALFLVSATLLFTLRIRREEQMMRDQFGEEYESYMRSSKRLIPWIF